MLTRRSVLVGLIAAPAVVKFASLMPVRGLVMDVEPDWLVFKNTNYTFVDAVNPYIRAGFGMGSYVADGTMERPYLTVAEAFRNMKKGGVLVLRDGLYEEDFKCGSS